MKFSLRLNNDLPAGDYVPMAQAAEQAGFDQFWVSNDLFLRSAPVILTAVAMATTRIQIGTCILNPYSFHPAEMAMMAATLDEISGGRFNLGLGSGAASFLKWIGIEQKLPLTAVQETAQALRALLAGERAPMTGKFLQWTDESYLHFKPSRQVPIYLGAMSPKMLTAIGAWADGGLPLLFPPEHYATVLPYIRAGADEAGRSLDEIDIAACVWCAVSEDRAAAVDALSEKIAYYGHAMSPLIWSQLGLTAADFAPLEHAVMVENDMVKAKSLVTEQMLRIGIVGTPRELIQRLEALVAMGVKHLSFGPPLGPDPLEAIRVIGREVIPHFRAKTASVEEYVKSGFWVDLYAFSERGEAVRFLYTYIMVAVRAKVDLLVFKPNFVGRTASIQISWYKQGSLVDQQDSAIPTPSYRDLIHMILERDTLIRQYLRIEKDSEDELQLKVLDQ